MAFSVWIWTALCFALIRCTNSLLKVLRARPTLIFLLPFWLARGRCYLKQAVTRAVEEFDPSLWPRNREVEALITEVKSSGATVELISAADHGLISGHSPFRQIFHEVIGSSDGLNLKGEAKARFLRERHPLGFAYVGDSAADLPVWRAAAERFAVNLSPSVRRRAAREGLGLVEIAAEKAHASCLRQLDANAPMAQEPPRFRAPCVRRAAGCGLRRRGIPRGLRALLSPDKRNLHSKRHPRRRIRPQASNQAAPADCERRSPLAACGDFRHWTDRRGFGWGLRLEWPLCT